MTHSFGNDRILFMHGPHCSVGVSRLAQPRFEVERPAPPRAIEIFAKPAEQTHARRLIDQLLANVPGGDWMLQLNVDRGDGEIAALEGSACALIVGGAEPFDASLLSELERHSERGGAIVALSVGEQTSPQWEAFCQGVLNVRLDDAATMTGKPTLRIAAGRQFHPVVRGVVALEIEEPCAEAVACGADALLECVCGGEKRLLAWTIDGIWRRAFGTLLGSPHDIEQSAFRRLVWNAVQWTMPQ